VRDLIEVAFTHVGLDWQKYVISDPAFYRPAEVDLLIGDAAHARATLGWKPRTGFEDLVRGMVDADLAALRAAPRGG
jgi:GDPmannose 4,6-dehydratase